MPELPRPTRGEACNKGYHGGAQVSKAFADHIYEKWQEEEGKKEAAVKINAPNKPEKKAEKIQTTKKTETKTKKETKTESPPSDLSEIRKAARAAYKKKKAKKDDEGK